MTIQSPGAARLICVGSLSMRAGIKPPVPQNTRGLPRKRSSNTTAPFTSGIPLWLAPSLIPRCTPLHTRFGCSRRGRSASEVDSPEASDGPAIGVEGRRRIVCFDLHDQVPLVVQLDYASVVMEHRDQPVDPLTDLFGSPHRSE